MTIENIRLKLLLEHVSNASDEQLKDVVKLLVKYVYALQIHQNIVEENFTGLLRTLKSSGILTEVHMEEAADLPDELKDIIDRPFDEYVRDYKNKSTGK